MLFRSVLVSLDLEHFPAKHHVDSTLMTFIKSNFVGVRESVDLLVWCPVLDPSVVGGAAMKFVLSHEVLVVQSVKVCSFSFVGELW